MLAGYNAIALSLSPSVRHTPVLYRNGLKSSWFSGTEINLSDPTGLQGRPHLQMKVLPSGTLFQLWTQPILCFFCYDISSDWSRRSQLASVVSLIRTLQFCDTKRPLLWEKPWQRASIDSNATTEPAVDTVRKRKIACDIQYDLIQKLTGEPA